MNKGFTLIELLVVVTIIGLLTGIGFLSYTQLNKSSRDARRKTNLEQIRMALEMYRSNNDVYPATASIDTTCGVVTGLTDSSSNTYLSDIPDDPKCSDYKYYYESLSTNTDYILGAYLEGSSSSCGSVKSCGNNNCNYCLGPFGKK